MCWFSLVWCVDFFWGGVLKRTMLFSNWLEPALVLVVVWERILFTIEALLADHLGVTMNALDERAIKYKTRLETV